jgi:hypothetical protein
VRRRLKSVASFAAVSHPSTQPSRHSGRVNERNAMQRNGLRQRRTTE